MNSNRFAIMLQDRSTRDDNTMTWLVNDRDCVNFTTMDRGHMDDVRYFESFDVAKQWIDDHQHSKGDKLFIVELAPNGDFVQETRIKPLRLYRGRMIEQLRHAFKDGHTDDDVSRVLPVMSRHTGLLLVVVWQFNDMYGISGDSNLCVGNQDGTISQCPTEITSFLYEGEGKVSQLMGLKAGPVDSNGRKPIKMSKHNYVWESDTSKQWNDYGGGFERELEGGEACERCGSPATEIREDEALCTNCGMEAENNPDGFYGDGEDE